ncbi:MAG: hypothetical protein EXR79_01875 [Myxococcales bacterium]|nr:hypothetical protein [Myxococcales bacterium]
MDTRTALSLIPTALGLAFVAGGCVVLDDARRARAASTANVGPLPTAADAIDGPDTATWTVPPIPAESLPWQRLVGAARLAGRIGRRPLDLDGGTSDDETGPAPAFSPVVPAAGPDPGVDRAEISVDVRSAATVNAEDGGRGEVPPLEYANVVYGAVVLEPAVAPDTTVGDGVFTALAREPVVRVRQGVRLGDVGAPVRGLVGQRVQLYDGVWPVCTARMARLALHVVFHRPWESTVLGRNPEQDLAAPASKFARAAWAHALAQPMLVAELDRVHGDCASATWARSLRLPAVAAVPSQPASPAWQRKATALLRRLPQWREVQSDYRGATLSGRRTARWDAYGSGIHVSIVRGRGETWLHAAASAGEGCGEFWGSLQALWRVTGDLDDPQRARVEQRGVDQAGEPLDLMGGADPDGDGSLDLLLRDGRVRGRLESQERVEVPMEWTCPC